MKFDWKSRRVKIFGGILIAAAAVFLFFMIFNRHVQDVDVTSLKQLCRAASDNWDKQAYARVRAEAMNGDADAQACLAGLVAPCDKRLRRACFEHPDGENSDFWYKKAAEGGNAEAEFWVGTRSGNKELIDKAAAAGSHSAWMDHCEYYYYQQKDPVEDYYWCTLYEKVDGTGWYRKRLAEIQKVLTTEQKAAIDKKVGEWVSTRPDFFVSEQK